MTLEEALQDVGVLEPGMWENDIGPKDWYAVCNDKGIVAYFGDETMAFNFRLHLINQMLNHIG
jgi:hypothetical protein